jgi:hypothetical protein
VGNQIKGKDFTDGFISNPCKSFGKLFKDGNIFNVKIKSLTKRGAARHSSRGGGILQLQPSD